MNHFSKSLLTLSLLICGLAHAAPQRNPFNDIMTELQRLSGQVSEVKAQTDSNTSAIMLNSQNLTSLSARVESLEIENRFLRAQLQAGSERMSALEEAVRALQASNPTDPTDPVDPVVCQFDLVLLNYGARKLDVIKAVNTIFGIGLARSKELVESAPVVLASSIPQADAVAMRRFLVDVGAEVSVEVNTASCQ